MTPIKEEPIVYHFSLGPVSVIPLLFQPKWSLHTRKKWWKKKNAKMERVVISLGARILDDSVFILKFFGTF